MTDVTHSIELAGNRTLLASESGDTIFLTKLGATAATGTLSWSGTSTNTQIVTIDTKVYTTLSTLTTADGAVLAGTAAATAINLGNAINLGPGRGVTYGLLTTRHPTVVNTTVGSTNVVTANIPGTAGNSIVTTDTQTNAMWGAATLAAGAVTGAASQNEFSITLPNDAVNGTHFKFITLDDGRTLVNTEEFFTNWTITALAASKSFIVTGNINGTVNGTRQLLNDNFLPGTSTRAILISNSPIGRGQKVNIPYLPGEILELTFHENVWYGSAFYGSRIRGAQAQ